MADEQNKPPRPRFGRVVAQAATNPWNLVVAGAGAVAAAATGAWAIAAIGGAAYAAMVALDSSNPNFWKKVFSGRAAAAQAKMPEEKQLLDPSTRATVAGLREAKAEIARVLKETPADVGAHLGGALAAIGELEDRAARLVVRAEALAAYLRRVEKGALEAEVARLGERARAARDAETRAEFEKAGAARADQLKTISDIADAKDRLDANLNRIVATLAGLPPKLVRMRALDAEAMDGLSGDLNEELDRMNTDIKTFEDTLKDLAEVAA